MSLPRMFLVTPEKSTALLAVCLTVACESGDVASLLVPPTVERELVALAQSKGVAVIVMGDPGMVQTLAADGVQVDAESVKEARHLLGKEAIVGAYAASSRHFAMEAAEAGADYVALAQRGASIGGEPIVKWCAEFMSIPVVAFEPAGVSDIDILLPQNPDFIRPLDAMWDDPDSARRIITELMSRLKA